MNYKDIKELIYTITLLIKWDIEEVYKNYFFR